MFPVVLRAASLAAKIPGVKQGLVSACSGIAKFGTKYGSKLIPKSWMGKLTAGTIAYQVADTSLEAVEGVAKKAVKLGWFASMVRMFLQIYSELDPEGYAKQFAKAHANSPTLAFILPDGDPELMAKYANAPTRSQSHALDSLSIVSNERTSTASLAEPTLAEQLSAFTKTVHDNKLEIKSTNGASLEGAEQVAGMDAKSNIARELGEMATDAQLSEAGLTRAQVGKTV